MIWPIYIPQIFSKNCSGNYAITRIVCVILATSGINRLTTAGVQR